MADVRIGLVVMGEGEWAEVEAERREKEAARFAGLALLAPTWPHLARVRHRADPDGPGGSWVRWRACPYRGAWAWTRLAIRSLDRWVYKHFYRLAPWWVWALLILAAGAALTIAAIGLAFAILWRP